MARALPPLTWFRAFDSAARHLSFTAAAQELGLTQSAISQQVNALELRFGCLLFQRKHRGLALTDEGRKLGPAVAQALGTLRQVSDQFDLGAAPETLTVATSVSIAQWYLAPRIAAFQDQHAGAAIRIITRVWPDEFSALRADVEIRFDTLATPRPGAEQLGRNQIVIVAAPALAAQATAAPGLVAQLGQLPLIQVLGAADSWQDWARSRGADSDLRPGLFVESHGMAVDLAAAGAGLALTSSAVAAPAINAGRLALVETDGAAASDGYLISLAPQVASDLPEHFSRWLAQEIAQAEDRALPG